MPPVTGKTRKQGGDGFTRTLNQLNEGGSIEYEQSGDVILQVTPPARASDIGDIRDERTRREHARVQQRDEIGRWRNHSKRSNRLYLRRGTEVLRVRRKKPVPLAFGGINEQIMTKIKAQCKTIEQRGSRPDG